MLGRSLACFSCSFVRSYTDDVMTYICPIVRTRGSAYSVIYPVFSVETKRPSADLYNSSSSFRSAINCVKKRAEKTLMDRMKCAERQEDHSKHSKHSFLFVIFESHVPYNLSLIVTALRRRV